MTLHLIHESDLAEILDKPIEWVASHRRKDHWPHINFGRFDKRYTDQQIAQILAMYEVAPKTKVEATALDIAAGLTKRARRSA